MAPKNTNDTTPTRPVAVESDDARNTVKSFCKYVAWLKVIHDVYIELFEREDAENLMRSTAAMFFADLNKIIVDYLLLPMAKITDPSHTGKHENFTVANLLETIPWPPAVMEQLNELNRKLTAFRGYIEPARNKLVAHLDKTAFLGDLRLGEFPEGQDHEVMEALEEMCNVMYEAAFGEIFGEISTAVVGDVLDLKRSLHRSIAFDKLLKNAQGEESSRLYQVLRSVEA